MAAALSILLGLLLCQPIELKDHAARHHSLQNKGSDVDTYKAILNHIAYQPIVKCFQKNRVHFQKALYGEELAKIKEALNLAAHDVPSAEEMRATDDAIDIAPRVITEMQCRALQCICNHIKLPYRVWDRKCTTILVEVRGREMRVLGDEEKSTLEGLIDRQAAVGMELEPEGSEPGAPAQPANEAEAEADS